ncbi:glycosyltransferase family 4 protein [Umboniibacter marinipuniceus]|uniref:Glycosyltransferase involved in cell wall biosynthesis n=1 Tax=Umboniibacter marinipuniceus TaxID=569599 RepID=A0A3M0A9M5_9GAMM|nr:glycosyltransferase family 4 protein [Umboniibacter marinipuniceus]RMA79538.1 glycosyltransferase involved in cell wall biosynthesis [Umboniibacter marinipuniceus]
MQARKTLLIFQESLMHYRVEFFNALTERYKVVVLVGAIDDKILEKDVRFEILKTDFKYFYRFAYVPALRTLIDRVSPEFVIAPFDLRLIVVISYMRHRFGKNMVLWGLDKGKGRAALGLKLSLARRFDNRIVFYSSHTMRQFIGMGLDESRCFFANNTFPVLQSKDTSKSNKDIILFVGSFDSRKRLPDLVDAFNAIQSNSSLKLILVGDGSCYEAVSRYVHRLGLQSKVSMVGKITNADELEIFYSRALCSVSYGQAGLSVLQSLAFGVPFITHRDSISGSEKFNIINSYNGYFVKDVDDLIKKIDALNRDRDLASELGANAYKFYLENCTVEIMCNQMIRAIEDVR